MADNDPQNPIAFIREIVSSAVWGVHYHEIELRKAYSDLGFAKELAQRMGCDATTERAEHDDSEEDLTFFENVEQLVCDVLDGKEYSVAYHERALANAHHKLAFAKILLARGNYTEIDLAEVTAEIKQELKAQIAHFERTPAEH